MYISFRPRRKLPLKGPSTLSRRISEALERNLAAPPQKITSLAEMSTEKQAEMRALYPPPTMKRAP